MDRSVQGPAGAVDVWALGVLLDEVLPADFKPSGVLANLQRRMLADAPGSRPSAAQLLKHSFFGGKELVQLLGFMEEFSIKDDNDKMAFFQRLEQAHRAGRLPGDAAIYKVLPVFRDFVLVEGTGPAASPSQRQVLLTALPLVLEVTKGLEGDRFTAMAEPVLLQLFDLSDRGIRAALMAALSSLAPKFSEASLNGRVFESVLGALGDQAWQLRELTVKNLLCMVERLSDRNLNDRLLRALAKLQGDMEPSVRTNTTILLGRMASHIKEGIRARTLLPAFMKSCKDPFPHARLAGLKAAAACASYFDAQDAAVKVLPIVSMALVSPTPGQPSFTRQAVC
jgi:SCY1-like protein 1